MSTIHSIEQLGKTAIFREYVEEKTGMDYIVVGNLTTTIDPVLMKHRNCGNTYYVRPHNFKKGSRCPHCKKTKKLEN